MPLDMNWVCPHCQRPVTIGDERYSVEHHAVYSKSSDGPIAVTSKVTTCPNPECTKRTIDIILARAIKNAVGAWYPERDAEIKSWRLLPWGAARSFPDFVPQAIRSDYVEACSIIDLSPKSAATLARRAVQGIVRDFWKISKRTLKDELDELATRVGTDVTQELWEGIDAVRTVGNIGAHMERDINVIVDVDPDEAQLLVQLVEILVQDTYVARNVRQVHAQRLIALKDQKAAERAAAMSPKTPTA